MIKNIIFDIGGVILDDSIQNISDLFKEDATELWKKAFGKSFKNCLLGNIEVSDYIETFKNDVDYDRETFREKEKLSNIRKNPFLTNKNDTKSEKICVNIKQKKKIKEPLSDLKEKKINTKKNINTNNISNSKEKIEIKNIDKEDYPNENINNNNLDVKTKNNNENKIVGRRKK